MRPTTTTWRLASHLVLLPALASCASSPTAISADTLRGPWELRVAANTGCDPDAVARTIHFSVANVLAVDPGLAFDGLWDFGAPTVVGWGLQGLADPAARTATITFIHATGAAMRFTGTFTAGGTMTGVLAEPTSGYEPLIPLGACQQRATGVRQE